MVCSTPKNKAPQTCNLADFPTNLHPDIQQKTCELLSTLSNKPPGAEFMHDVLTDVTVYDGENIPLECWLLQIEKAQ